ncbi:uncharacterized protein LY79DRAFT_398228 [Colletotrichum navitas]|uniref:N-acetyltransferase ESCO zinc-finger domain-containing protein n=1 Tax=Colletotrichum navitas TaxID=681940 RepID=A0AAD8PQ66_9PEZI|nr:uncharacterized protein LY79DRAFT_398228 [Colletotrichum navitas]KAK1573739.1 hypothetical protein LY79DRAFT_398228 [Colletotrichum navitas]
MERTGEETKLLNIQRDVPRPTTTDKRRNLRTYSKRSRPTEYDDTGPGLLKKRRVTAEPATRTPELPRLYPAQPTQPSSNIPKSSILSYFKPCRSSSATESSDPLSDSEKLINTPPSSPPVFHKIKEPRRLRLRPSNPILPSSDTVENAKDGGDEGGDVDTTRTGRVLRSSRTQIGKELKEVTNSKLNELRDDKEVKEAAVPKKPPSRSKSVATVQTTINLSSKPAFMECKICRILYNPLHPPDVKYHSQRHAAFLRARARARNTA